jgi:DNA invertase Pin-like site-specific DNA recombinase
MIYGYARVSTVKQISGNSLEDQEAILKGRGCQEIVVEQYTGKTTDRPKLDGLVSRLEPGDTLIVTKLDRLARTVEKGSKLIQSLIDNDITVIIDNMGTISNKPMDKLMLNILLAFAEFERDMIIERTQAGKEIARTKDGFKDGRPQKFTEYQLQNALGLLDSHSYTQVEKLTGISKSTLTRLKRKSRGGR